MGRNGVVKSTGPDVDKILGTLEFFGPRYTYVITGYPPFLKHLVDEGTRRGFDWRPYRLFGGVGGEGMSEGLRDYLERTFAQVYSGYGASDLDMGVAGETPLSIWVRKRAAEDPRIQRALFGDDPRLPMLFQYNPLDYYVESNERRELIVTISRLAVLSPRIRYNIHDAGGTITFDAMLALLRELGLGPLPDCARPGQPILRLPFLYLFGRSDATISYMGANIYPEDVEQALFADPDDARRLGAYCLEVLDIGHGEQRPAVHVEVLDGAGDDPALADRLRQRVLDRLLAVNRDFRSAVDEDPSARDLRIHLHPTGHGPFTANSGRIKRRYILRATAPVVVALPDR
jgi:phenylacetate-CoA ligase